MAKREKKQKKQRDPHKPLLPKATRKQAIVFIIVMLLLGLLSLWIKLGRAATTAVSSQDAGVTQAATAEGQSEASTSTGASVASLNQASSGGSDASSGTGGSSQSASSSAASVNEDATAYLALYSDQGAAGTGEVLELTVPSATTQLSLRVGTEGFPTSRSTFVYVDGALVAEYASTSDVTLRLAGERLQAGEHTVEAVQYSGDDPTGAATLYKKAVYNIVEG